MTRTHDDMISESLCDGYSMAVLAQANRMCVGVHVRVCVRVYASEYEYICVCVHMCVRVGVYVWMHVCAYVRG